MGKGFGLSGGSNIKIKDGPLMGAYKALAIEKVCRYHYLHSVPVVKAYWYGFGGAVVCFSIPPNKEIGKFLLGKENKDNAVWELSRLWAPDGHEKNLLTMAISRTVAMFRKREPDCLAIVSYADPNVGHEGFVYKAASWIYTGKAEERMGYVRISDGVSRAEKSFWSNTKGRMLNAKEIARLGYKRVKHEGKFRYVLGLRRWVRKRIKREFTNA